LHHIFGRLPIADDLSQITQQTRPHFSIKRIERLRITAANALPQLAILNHVVSQLLSPHSYSGLRPKKFITNRNCGALDLGKSWLTRFPDKVGCSTNN
jgi:hypothetical protein